MTKLEYKLKAILSLVLITLSFCAFSNSKKINILNESTDSKCCKWIREAGNSIVNNVSAAVDVVQDGAKKTVEVAAEVSGVTQVIEVADNIVNEAQRAEQKIEAEAGRVTNRIDAEVGRVIDRTETKLESLQKKLSWHKEELIRSEKVIAKIKTQAEVGIEKINEIQEKIRKNSDFGAYALGVTKIITRDLYDAYQAQNKEKFIAEISPYYQASEILSQFHAQGRKFEVAATSSCLNALPVYDWDITINEAGESGPMGKKEAFDSVLNCLYTTAAKAEFSNRDIVTEQYNEFIKNEDHKNLYLRFVNSIDDFSLQFKKLDIQLDGVINGYIAVAQKASELQEEIRKTRNDIDNALVKLNEM